MGKFNLIFDLDKVIMDIGAGVLSFFRLHKLLADQKYLIQNKELFEKKKRDICYVVGLGPSLKYVDLSKLDGDIIVTNRFTNVEGASLINPTFYCLIDGYFYNNKNDDTLKKATEMFSDSTFILNGKYRKTVPNLIDKEINDFYVYIFGGVFNHKNSIDLSKKIPLSGNVVITALFLALYLKYKKIVLIGCDFNSFASRKPIHCYEDESEERQISLAFELFCYSFVADTHYEINKYALDNNIEIVNATQGSLIDAYRYDAKLADILKK